MTNNLFFLQEAGEVAKSFPGSELIAMFSNSIATCSFSFVYSWLSRRNAAGSLIASLCDRRALKSGHMSALFWR
jgi:hypothetical protein